MKAKAVVIGTDHGALELKQKLISFLEGRGYMVEDVGVYTDESVDYPDTSGNVCRAFIEGEYEFGISLCGTGIGASIAANKIPGIRCALIHDSFTAEMAKAHNNANIVAMGGRIHFHEPVEQIIAKFIDSRYLGDDQERHGRRVNKLGDLDCR